MTLDQAKIEMESLNEFIELVENYEVKNIEDWIIKNYAMTNSISGVIKNSLSVEDNNQIATQLSRDFILNVIKSKPKDKLHKIVRSAYFKKIRKPRKF